MARTAALVTATALAATGLLTALAGPASAAGDTVTTFTITGAANGLSVSSPGTASAIGTAAAGASSLSGSLGAITVTDTRAALTATWTAKVSATDFTTGGGSANETVQKSAITYSSGVGTAQLGQVGAMVPSLNVSLAGTGGTAATWAGVGNNTVTWTPTLTFSLLASQVAGTYTGTITHSVS